MSEQQPPGPTGRPDEPTTEWSSQFEQPTTPVPQQSSQAPFAASDGSVPDPPPGPETFPQPPVAPAQPGPGPSGPSWPPPTSNPPFTPAAPPPPPGGSEGSPNLIKGLLIAAGIAICAVVLAALALGAAHAIGDRHGGSGGPRERDGHGPNGRDFGNGRGPNGGDRGDGLGPRGRNGPDFENGFPGGRNGLPPGVPNLDHGDFVVTGADGKPVTKRIVRGVVTGVSPTVLTVKAADGYIGTFTLDANTLVIRNGRRSAANAVAAADTATVIGTVSGATATANNVIAFGAEAGRQPTAAPTPKPS